MKSSIYAVRCEGFIKIGMAKNVESRMKTLETMQPFSLSLERSAPYEMVPARGTGFINVAQLIERDIHLNLQFLGFRHKGEWFTRPAVALGTFDAITGKFTPDIVAARAAVFISASNSIKALSKDLRRKMKEEFGDDYEFILQRFWCKEPRTIQMLIDDTSERVLKVMGSL